MRLLPISCPRHVADGTLVQVAHGLLPTADCIDDLKTHCSVVTVLKVCFIEFNQRSAGVFVEIAISGPRGNLRVELFSFVVLETDIRTPTKHSIHDRGWEESDQLNRMQKNSKR